MGGQGGYVQKKVGESVEVAASMRRHRGLTRESIIAGLSVHNQRIDRVWRSGFVGVGHFFYPLFTTWKKMASWDQQVLLTCSVCITVFAQELTIN